MRDEPNMSDTTILVSVEDLINMAMGPPNANTVDFKMVQMILHILARQMRLLEQKVVLEVGPLPAPKETRTDRSDRRGDTSESTSSSRGKAGKKGKGYASIKEEGVGRGADSDGGGRKRSRSEDRGRGGRKRSSDDAGGRGGGHGSDDDRGKGRSKSAASGRDDRKGGKDDGKGGRDTDRGGKSDKDGEKGGRGGKDAERGGRSDKDYEKGGTGGKDAEKGGRAVKDYEKGGKGGKDVEKGGKGGRDDDRSASSGKETEKGGKSGKGDIDTGKGGVDTEKGSKDKGKGVKGDKESERGGRDVGKGGRDAERGGKDAEKGGIDSGKGGKGGKDSEKGGRDTESGGRDAKSGGRDAESGSRDAEKGGKGGKDKAQGRYDADERETDRDSRREKEGIGIKEVPGKGKDKAAVLVVGKVSTTGARADRGRRSIEVVTRSQFALLEAAVEQLQKKSLPPPPPSMPGNEKLRSDLASGSATLTDAMQAMQVAARVQAAEQAIGRLGGLLTSLAAAGALPEGALDDDDEGEYPSRRRPSTTSRKSVVIQSTKGDRRQSAVSGAGAGSLARSSVASGLTQSTGGPRASVAASTGRPSIMSRASAGPLVTQGEMTAAMTELRQDLMKSMQSMVGRTQANTDSAATVAKSIGEKLDLAVRLNSRINSLNSLVEDYAEQLAGFDAGLTTQMMSFQEQMLHMRKDLDGGLAQLANANNNAETAAVMELNERYELLVNDLDRTLLAHQALTSFQNQLSADFGMLYSAVEMLREQKADRDEVLDGLRDKADNERLAGLLREEDFIESRMELETRLELCHEKFRKQDNMWVTAIKDLTHVVQTKAELMDLLKTREETTQQLQAIQDMIKKLALVLGEPKAAMLTRKLARDGTCGVCLVPALMDPEDAAGGAPPRLPAALAARGAPVGAEAVCEEPWHPPQPPDLRSHKCHRWVGGSHTLLSVANRAAPAPPDLSCPSTKKYAGVGIDGRLYMMEAELQPCIECNPLEEEAGGDSRPLGVLYHGVDVVGLDEPCSCFEEERKEGKMEDKESMKKEQKGGGEQRPATAAISFVKSFGKA